MYHQQQSLVLPHHLEGLQYLPANFPIFFQGLPPQVLLSNGIQNLDLAGLVQKKLLKYVIESVKPGALKPVIIMYRVLSSNEFQNQEFYNLVLMAMKCVEKLLSRGMDISRAIDESFMNAAARWVVNYLKANGQAFGLNHDDVAILNRIESNVTAFESKFMGQQQAPQQANYGGQMFHDHSHGHQGYNNYGGQHGMGQHHYQHQQYQTQPQVDVMSAVGSMYSNSGPSHNPSAYADVELNTGTILSALDVEEEVTPVMNNSFDTNLQGVDPSKIAEEFFEPFIAHVPDVEITEMHEPEPVPMPTKIYVKELVPEVPVEEVVAEKLSSTDTKVEENVNSKIPNVVRYQGDPVDFSKHDIRRLFRNGNLSEESSLIGDSVLKDIASVKIANTYPPIEGEITDNVDLGVDTIKTVALSFEQRSVVNDSDLRVYLSGLFTEGSHSIITSVVYPELIDITGHHEEVLDIFGEAKTHEEISEVIRNVLEKNEEGPVTEIFRIIDKRLASIITDVINHELGITGSMDTYYNSIISVLDYLENSVNEISFDQINDNSDWFMDQALSGLKYGTLEDSVVMCYTKMKSSEFPYLFAEGDNSPRLGRINPMVTPDLHAAVNKIFEYLDSLEDSSRNAVRKVQLMTYDGAKLRLYQCPFTNCFNVVKESQ